MFGRIFGRGKDEPDQAVCASCGRTLLAGEWTQQITDADGEDKLICSLCSQSRPLNDGEQVKGTTTPANAGKVRESRSDSDAFWKALKDKDLEIERLQALLARAEAEKQELLGRLARSGGQVPDVEAAMAAAAAGVAAAPAAGPAAADAVAAEDVVVAAESSRSGPAEQVAADDGPELASETWGETPAELAAALAEFDQMPAPAPEPEPQVAAPEQPAIAFEDTQPIPTVGDELPDDDDELAADETDDAPATVEEAPGAEDTQDIAAEAPIAPILAGEPQEEEPEEQAAREAEAAQREAEAAASLTLLQRGVDLINVSTVPRKIAETNEHLGMPSVHVGFDGQTVAVTFLWSMGWYRFTVDIDSGAVKMAERGYEERRDLQPNAGVRADGTVHLAPAQISRAAAQKQTAPPEQVVEPAEERAAEAEPEPPSVAAQKAPEFVSKSLLGQRSDDEPNPWDQAKARDFNWDR